MAGEINTSGNEVSLTSAPRSNAGCTDVLRRDSFPVTLLEDLTDQSQASSSIDSSLSEDATDWEEDSDLENSYYWSNLRGSCRLPDEVQGNIL